MDRSQVLQALPDAIPQDRMVQVRIPQMKQRFILLIAHRYTGSVVIRKIVLYSNIPRAI